jgi:hypothetical protein
MNMRATTRALAKSTYAVVGTVLLATGASVLLVRTGLLPDALGSAIVDESAGDLNTLHIMQELGSVLVFVGLITFWFLRHYEQSQPFHWSMTAFWGLFALAHWFDVRGPVLSIGGPLVTTVSFLLFVSLGLLRTATEGARGSEKVRNAADRKEQGGLNSPSPPGRAGTEPSDPLERTRPVSSESEV